MSGAVAASSPSLLRRVVFVAVAVALVPELLLRFLQVSSPDAPGVSFVAATAAPVLGAYFPLRSFVIEHPARALSAAVAIATVLLLAGRKLVVVWHNELLPRIAGTHFRPDALSFELAKVDLLELVRNRPPATTVVGVSPPRSRFGAATPVYLSERQRSTHRHVLGKTGSGKTLSVLFPTLLQDVLAGKGALFIDGKGSDENLETILGIAAVAGRERDVRIFSLPAWNQPQLFSHTYNLLHVTPRGPGPDRPGGDPAVTAERVFSVLAIGDNVFYLTQSKIMFTNLCRLLHGIVDDDWRGLPFTLRDVSVCLKGLATLLEREADPELDEDRRPRRRDGWGEALRFCLDASKDQIARRDIESQVHRLGRKVHETLSGLVGAIDSFDAPLVNAYHPDIVFEEVLEENLIVYAQLPANMFKAQAPALGRAILMDLQQGGALRQVFRRERNQTAFSVIVDEFGRFAEQQFVDSLSQLRDANLQFTIAHQSLADLELVSREFANAVWDNTRTKDVLAQDNPALCEMLAKSIGTEQRVEHTVRRQSGPLFTAITTQDASSRLVEAYRLHPNRIKNLARCGQGYLYTDEGLMPVSYPLLPSQIRASYELPRNSQDAARGIRLYERFVADASAPDRAAGGMP